MQFERGRSQWGCNLRGAGYGEDGTLVGGLYSISHTSEPRTSWQNITLHVLNHFATRRKNLFMNDLNKLPAHLIIWELTQSSCCSCKNIRAGYFKTQFQNNFSLFHGLTIYYHYLLKDLTLVFHTLLQSFTGNMDFLFPISDYILRLRNVNLLSLNFTRYLE